MRRRFIWDRKANALVEVDLTYRAPQAAPTVWNDLPAYESPIDGKPVDGRKQRREDLKRSGCRPYEGLDAERKEAERKRGYSERAADQLAERMAHDAWNMAPERVRKVFRSR